MRRLKQTLIILFLMAAAALPAYSAEPISAGETLNLERCLKIAQDNQPNIMVSNYNVQAVKSQVGQAASYFLPTVNLNASYSRVQPASQNTSGLTGAAAILAASTSTSAFDQYKTSIGLTQNIFDFGKVYTGVDIQKQNLKSAQSDLDNTVSQVEYQVKQAYFSRLQAKHNQAIAEEAVNSYQQHLDQAQGFYKVGTKPKFDVTKAEVDLSNAKLQLVQADNALKIAVVNLNNAMGLADPPDYDIEDNLSFAKYEISYDDAIGKAYDSRPDLKSLMAKGAAAKKNIYLNVTGYLPAFAGFADYNWAGENFPLQDSWDLGLGLNFNIFNGFLTQYQINQAKAQYNVVKANEASLRLGILLDVRQSYLNLKAAEDTIPVAELAVKQAQENLDLANGRYSAGVGNPIEVTDSQLAYSNAETNHIQALYNYKVAQASLEKAMGVK
jgi:outer membrane protein